MKMIKDGMAHRRFKAELIGGAAALFAVSLQLLLEPFLAQLHFYFALSDDIPRGLETRRTSGYRRHPLGLCRRGPLFHSPLRKFVFRPGERDVVKLVTFIVLASAVSLLIGKEQQAKTKLDEALGSCSWRSSRCACTSSISKRKSKIGRPS